MNQLNIYDGFFCENKQRFLALTILAKKLHFRCLTGP